MGILISVRLRSLIVLRRHNLIMYISRRRMCSNRPLSIRAVRSVVRRRLVK
jgi:hypothetical protein